MLVMIGATPEGRKELVGFQVGVRESAQSWRELLVDLRSRGLSVPPDARSRRRRPRVLEGDGGGFPRAHAISGAGPIRSSNVLKRSRSRCTRR